MPRFPLVAEGEGALPPRLGRKVSSIHGGFMADPQVLTTLRRKQAEIENAIAAYEKRVEAGLPSKRTWMRVGTRTCFGDVYLSVHMPKP